MVMSRAHCISLLYQAGLVPVRSAVASWLRGLSSVRRLATRLAGIASIGLGIRLAAGNR